ncbi:ribosome maturation factor RimM [Spongisporangium articulatum]|uniref:Ribosome maturation factor RimM n=1 Tax=Spongisporangium articulatum TaxID=3362603 RepID=A0ABW8AQ45_9ACTN
MRLVVARIGRAHGIRGEVSIEVRTDSPGDRFVAGAVLYPVDGRPPLTVRTVRDHNGTVLLTFAEIGDRTAAEGLRDVVLEADVPDSTGEDDAWYPHELVGLAVVAPDGEPLGEVVGLQNGGAQDLLVVRRPDGERRLVPFVTTLVPEVDVAGGRVVVDAPPGLLEDLPDED